MPQPRFETLSAPYPARALSPYWGEHVARYCYARPLVAGKRVLDIACGTGYGLPFLQTSARQVIGVDVEWAAARRARTELLNGTGCIVVGDGCQLPFADASFDVITSFETLEHLAARAQFLAELRRVLVERGLCILSTPNANYTQPINGKPSNPYHVFEYTPAELLGELQAQFSQVQLLGQTLDRRFAVPPFWLAQRRLPRTVKAQSQLLLWRIINKMPVAVRDRVSHAVWGCPFYPDAPDYHFEQTKVNEAPVLVALCG